MSKSTYKNAFFKQNLSNISNKLKSKDYITSITFFLICILLRFGGKCFVKIQVGILINH